MKRKWLFVVGVIILAILVSLAGVMYFRLQKMKLSDIPGVAEQPGIRQVLNYPASPVQKSLSESRQEVLYELEGEFIGSFREPPERQDNVMVGKFVLRDDPLMREIDVLMLGGTLLFGKYDRSFISEVVWRNIPTDEIIREIIPGETVKISVVQSLSTDGDGEYFVQLQAVFDSIIEDFREGKHDSNIPDDFFVTPRRLGVAR